MVGFSPKFFDFSRSWSGPDNFLLGPVGSGPWIPDCIETRRGKLSKTMFPIFRMNTEIMNFAGINIEFFAIDFKMRSLCFKAKLMAIFFLVIVVIGVIVHDFSSVRFLFYMVQNIKFMVKK